MPHSAEVGGGRAVGRFWVTNIWIDQDIDMFEEIDRRETFLILKGFGEALR